MRQFDAEYPGLTGGVSVALRGPDYSQALWYLDFAAEAEAQQHFEFGELGRSAAVPGDPDPPDSPTGAGPPGGSSHTSITRTFVPPDFDHPSWCVVGRNFTGNRHWPWTSCTVLVANVVVGGSSTAQPGPGTWVPERGDTTNAIALARAGVERLIRMHEGMRRT